MSGPKRRSTTCSALTATAFKAAYDVTPAGNWEGRTILRRIAAAGDDATEAALAQARATDCS